MDQNDRQDSNSPEDPLKYSPPQQTPGHPLGMRILFLILGVVAVVAVVSGGYMMMKRPPSDSQPDKPQFQKDAGGNVKVNNLAFKKFASEAEFKEYLSRGSRYGSGLSLPQLSQRGLAANEMSDTSVSSQGPLPMAGISSTNGDVRQSETNVQVKGIDEPDIVKVGDKTIFYSMQKYLSQPKLLQPGMPVSDYNYNQYYDNSTQIISAFPVESLATKGKIDLYGNLLLEKNVLSVLSDRKISGYDVSNPEQPVQKWNLEIDKDFSVSTARLFNGKIYLVTQKYGYSGIQCPMRPFTSGTADFSIRCTDIYYPTVQTDAQNTYTVMVINPQTGNIEKNVSFVGSDYSTVVYMSPQSIYITYSVSQDYGEVFLQFFKESGSGMFPQDLITQFERVQGYDISSQSKMTELGILMEKFQSGLSEDKRKEMEIQLQDRMKTFSKNHIRDFVSTGIVKLGIENLDVLGNGSVPGSLLNQFSMDEYNGNLRVATSVGSTWFGSRDDSLNDVYVLDGSMKVTGKALDMGKGEKIYSVRFLEDKGYLVTFKQIDPFYVLDLSVPSNPQIKGELKIPGFSSYLDPLAKNLILGVGSEDSKTKLSLFDVNDPQNPKEIDKILLEDYWTEVSTNHHAFLKDDKYKTFFMPGSNKGYLFSYEGNKLSLKKTLSDIQAKRAVYIENFYYIVSDTSIQVVDQNTFEVVKTLTF